MKLYNKKLNSLADLKRERYLMKYAKQVHHMDDLFALDSRKGKKKKEKAVEAGSPLGMIGGLFGAGPAAAGLLGNKQFRRFLIRRIPKKTIGRVAKEVLFGYLKWKAIELSYGIIAGALRKRKEKKRAEFLADAHHPIHQYSEREYQRARGRR